MSKPLLTLASFICVATFFLAVVSPPRSNVSAQETDSTTTDMAEQAQEQFQKKNRLREGAEIVDQSGSVEWIGDRLCFTPEKGGHVFKILENRMMERVVQTQESSTGKLVWVVTGTITEYRGSNFLLMKHVILDGKRSD